jgi:hypothetical protein
MAASVVNGISSATLPATATMMTRSTPETTPAHRERAPEDTLTPVRDSDSPDGRAWNSPPATLASPWAKKSRDTSEWVPSEFG